MKQTTPLKNQRAGVAVAALASLLLSGCVGGTSQDANDGAIKTVLRAPVGTGELDKITWNLGSGEPETLRPTNVPTYSGLALVANLCDSLLTVDENGTLGPGLTKLEMESPTRAVFTLQADAKFWNGNPVTTQDIAFSLNFAASPDSLMAPSYKTVSNVELISDKQVAINFSSPDVALLPTLTGAGGAVMEKAFTERAGSAVGTPSGGLMCSGPFKLDNWSAGSSLRILKNDQYWNKDKLPRVKEVNFTFVTDTSALTQALSTGEIDGGWEIPSSAIPALTNSKAGKLFYGDTTSVWSLRVASPNSPLAKDPDLREGLQRIVDRDAISKAIFHGAAQPWSSAISMNSWPAAVRDEAKSRYESIASNRSFDVGEATELFKNSGVDSLSFEVLVQSGDQIASQLSQLLQDQLRAAGVDLKIRSLQPLEFAEAMYNPAVRDNSDLLLSANGDIVQEPLASIRYFYLKDGVYNWDGFNDAEVESLFNKAVADPNEESRTKTTLDIQDRFEASAATIAITNPYQVNFLSNHVGGAITSSTYTSLPSLAYLGGTGN